MNQNGILNHSTKTADQHALNTADMDSARWSGFKLWKWNFTKFGYYKIKLLTLWES